MNDETRSRTAFIRILIGVIGLLLIIWSTLEILRIERALSTKIDPRTTVCGSGVIATRYSQVSD